MAESVPDEQPTDITSRPYLQGLPVRRQTPAASGGSAHLHAAATGRPTPTSPPARHTAEGVPIQLVPANGDLLGRTEWSASPPPPAARTAATEPAASPAPAATPAVTRGVDYALVTRHVRELDFEDAGAVSRSRETFDIADASQWPETPEEQTAWTQIEVLVDRHVSQLVLQQGENSDWTPRQRTDHIQAVFDEAFRYGPLSPLLREDVENIDIHGYDLVTVTLPDGKIEERPPVTGSDDQLEEFIAKITSDRGRQFARPHGKIRLDLGGARFTALGGPQILPRPRIAVRKHRLVDIDLSYLVRHNTLTNKMATLLTASARAYLSHLVSGYPGTGKTTFLRALSSALPPYEPIVTIETERELYLHKLTDRHKLVDPLQYLPDVNSGDDRTAAFSLDDGIEYGVRLNAKVIIFGEILGPDEANAAIKALQAGKGASSTIHAASAYDAIQRLSTMLVEAGGFSDEVVPQRQIMHALDLIVQLDVVSTDDGGQRRVITEIAEIIPGDAPIGQVAKPIVRPIYRWNEDGGVFEFVEAPSKELTRRLVRAGLSPTFFEDQRA